MQRRHFLKHACIASAGLLTGCPSTPKGPAGYQASVQDDKLVVPRSNLSPGTILAVEWHNKRIGLAQVSEQTYRASLMRCTHLGCALDTADGGYVCPCHGAKFDSAGNLLKGPAAKNLQVFATSIDEQNIYIHTR